MGETDEIKEWEASFFSDIHLSAKDIAKDFNLTITKLEERQKERQKAEIAFAE